MDELRRGFHDRLADVHAETGRLVHVASGAVADATGALVSHDAQAAEAVSAVASAVVDRHHSVELEVFDLIALQAPVARDLRVLLATLWVAQEAQLSCSLGGGIAARVGRLDPTLFDAAVQAGVEDVGRETAHLLDRAGQAYDIFDPEWADLVLRAEPAVRTLHRRLLTNLFAVRHAPVESAVELGVVTRCYERITDHATEIADRVRFVAFGPDQEGADPG